jgi:hypothetical protein
MVFYNNIIPNRNKLMKKEAHEQMAETQSILDRLLSQSDHVEVTARVDDAPVAGAVRLQLDFPSSEAMVEFVDKQMMVLNYKDLSFYAVDSLDAKLPDSNIFVMRHHGDRPESRRLKIFQTTEE